MKQKKEWDDTRVDAFNAQIFAHIDTAKKADAVADLSGVVFPGNVTFERYTGPADGLPELICRQATFGGRVSFGGVQFTREADFSQAVFSGDANFVRATFGGGARFSSVRFDGIVAFHDVTFGRAAHFHGVKVNDTALFLRSVFSGNAEFRRAEFNKAADFREALLGGRRFL